MLIPGLSRKFAYLLTLSSSCDKMKRMHFFVKCRDQPFERYGVTIKRCIYFQFGRFWSSFFAFFNAECEKVIYENEIVDVYNELDMLIIELDDILSFYGNFADYLDSMMSRDFCIDDLPDPDEEGEEFDAFLFGKGTFDVHYDEYDDDDF